MINSFNESGSQEELDREEILKQEMKSTVVFAHAYVLCSTVQLSEHKLKSKRRKSTLKEQRWKYGCLRDLENNQMRK